jgi:hypothetical protein
MHPKEIGNSYDAIAHIWREPRIQSNALDASAGTWSMTSIPSSICISSRKECSPGIQGSAVDRGWAEERR